MAASLLPAAMTSGACRVLGGGKWLGPEKAALRAGAQAKWPEVTNGKYTLSL